jgi:hypothetical protein
MMKPGMVRRDTGPHHDKIVVLRPSNRELGQIKTNLLMELIVQLHPQCTACMDRSPMAITDRNVAKAHVCYVSVSALKNVIGIRLAGRRGTQPCTLRAGIRPLERLELNAARWVYQVRWTFLLCLSHFEGRNHLWG